MFALDLLNQFQSYNGTLLAAGKIYVYKLGRTELAPVYGDHNGATVIANPVILDDQGMAEIYLNDAFNYTIVVFDAYGQEQFSRDIYPSGMGKGESIGTQLYEGIDPIVVNNDIYAISANTTKLGVQDPLYFVQDDSERVIIGFSGNTEVPPGTMNESAFGYEDGQITSYNGSAFSAGLNYVAGDNIVINGNEIALDSAITLVDQSHTKGMQLDATEQQFTNLTSNNGSILDASGLYVSDLNMENAANLSKDGLYVTGTGSRISMSNDMSDIYGDNHFEIYGYQESGNGVSSMILGGNDLIVEHGENGFITASYSLTGACQSAVSALNTITATSGNYYPMEGNPSGFLTAHQDISDKLDTTAFSTVSGDFLTAVPSEYITENTLQSGLSSKLDSTAFSTVSGDFLTAHQSLDGLMSADLLEISDNKITGYNGTAFAGQGGVTGDFTLVEGNGIQLTDDPIAQTTTISVSGDYATLEDVESATSALFPNSAVTPLVNSIFANTVNYQSKPSTDAIYAQQNSLVNVGQIAGLGNSNFVIVPSAALLVPKIITAYDNGFTANGITANGHSDNGGISAVGLIANTGGISASGLTAGGGGSFCIKCAPELFSGGGQAGFTFSSLNTAFGTAQLTTAAGNQIVQMYSPKFEARNPSGAGFSIEASGAKGYDHNGNVTWDTTVVPAPDRLISFAATQPAILISPTPSSQSGYAPYLSADYQELAIKYNNGPSAIMNLNGFSIKNGNNQASIGAQGIAVTGDNINLYVPETSASYSLRNSIQQSMIEGDTATSAITAIAGSAIGGGGGVPQSAFDELKQSYDALSALFAQYSGQWLLPNEGEE